MATTRKKQRKRQPVPHARRPPRAGSSAAPRAPPSKSQWTWITPRTVVIAGLVVLAVVVLVAMFGSEPRIAGQNGVFVQDVVTETKGRATTFCQNDEVLPKDTASVELSLIATSGLSPRVRVQASKDGRVLTQGTSPAGWTGETLAIPVRSVPRTALGVRLCISVGKGGNVQLVGTKKDTRTYDTSPPTTQDQIKVAYVRPGSESWWAYAPTVLHRMGLGRAWSGSWIVLVILALMIAPGAIAIRQLLRAQTRGPPAADDEDVEPPQGMAARARASLRRVPRTAWVCALIALLNAGAWSFLTPPFQAPDELDHFAYVQLLAETGKPPSKPSFGFSEEERVALAQLKQQGHLATSHIGVWSTAEQQSLERLLDARPSRAGSGAAGTAAAQPPLYYALETIPYSIARGGSLLERMTLMRLLSALLAAVTAFFAYLFVREALPGVRWAWTVAGLATALQPMLGYISGSINADALLFPTSAALLYCIARGFRRELTPALAVAIGAAVAIGVLTKLTFAALLPAVAIALVGMAIRQEPDSKLRALRLPGIAVGVALVPILFEAWLSATAWDRDRLGGPITGATAFGSASGKGGSLLDKLNYVWQFYLPRLPGTADTLPGEWSTRDGWAYSFVGQFGYTGSKPPRWVLEPVLLAAVAAIALSVRALIQGQEKLRARALEFAVYGLMVVGIAVGIAVAAYGAEQSLRQGGGYLFQARYFFPLAALMAGVVALAARGAGRRVGPAIGAAIVMLVLAHNLLSQVTALAHWYG
jgi:hypothetical protein